MTERPVLAPRLRELDETLAQRGMAPGARARVEARLRQEALRREATAGFRFRWLPALTFAAGAALVLLVVSLRLGGPSDAPHSPRDPAAVFGGAFAVHGAGCRYREHAHEVELEGTCRLAAPHLAVHTWDRVRLRHEASGGSDDVRLVDGTALFDVTKVEAGDSPTRILVSHGVIEVLGTRFTIEQGPHGGHVDLFEGRIRFVDLEGVATEIAPGQRYTWGDAVAALSLTPQEDGAAEPSGATGRRTRAGEPSRDAALGDDASADADASAEADSNAEGDASADDDAHARNDATAPKPPRASRRVRPRADEPRPAEAAPTAGTTDEATAIIDEVARLRAQGRYAEAADVLRRADRTRRWDARTAQVLSYELGEIIERHLGDREAACQHWARHAKRWGEGRYARAVKAAQERLGCPAAPLAADP